MKKLVLAVAIAISSTTALAAPKEKPVAKAAKALCANDVCLKLSQKANVALFQAKLDVILLGEAEYQKKIPSAVEAMMVKTKASREEIRPFYTAALASVAGNPEATAAVKDYMKVWTAAINSFPMQTGRPMGEREAEYQGYVARLNDAWARIQIDAGI